jgi:acetylornithine/succinyldiaminopimelate/putrescine aminotransferase
VLVLTAGDDVVRLAPPLTIGTEEVDEALGALAVALEAA